MQILRQPVLLSAFEAPRIPVARSYDWHWAEAEPLEVSLGDCD
jgi:hypothetical protein